MTWKHSAITARLPAVTMPKGSGSAQIYHPFGKGSFYQKTIDNIGYGKAVVKTIPLTKVKVPDARTFPPEVIQLATDTPSRSINNILSVGLKLLSHNPGHGQGE